jgi:hypothetical protein
MSVRKLVPLGDSRILYEARALHHIYEGQLEIWPRQSQNGMNILGEINEFELR